MSNLKILEAEQSRAPSSLDLATSMGTIDPVVRKKALFKIDVAVMGCFGLMYFLANLDRNNLVSTKRREKVMMMCKH